MINKLVNFLFIVFIKKINIINLFFFIELKNTSKPIKLNTKKNFVYKVIDFYEVNFFCAWF